MNEQDFKNTVECEEWLSKDSYDYENIKFLQNLVMAERKSLKIFGRKLIRYVFTFAIKINKCIDFIGIGVCDVKNQSKVSL